jgi:hypothetical protein
MKTNPLINALLGMLCVGAIATFALAIVFEVHFRQLQRLQPQVAQAQNGRNLSVVLAEEVLKYSEHNPAIDPILQVIGAKPVKGPAATAPRTQSR